MPTLIVLGLAAGFVRLGIWQLDRHDEVGELNRVGESRLSEPVVEWSTLIESAVGDPGSLTYRRARVQGVFDPEEEVLIRSQIHLGSAGFHVITPLVLEDGSAVLVNRGWVPLALDTVPVTQASPPAGESTIEGWVESTRTRPLLGPKDPPAGRLEVMSRVDIERIQVQTSHELAGVYLVSTGGGEAELPAPVSPPGFDDDGPHLGYAIQWFGFALVGLIGYPALVRRRSGQSR